MADKRGRKRLPTEGVSAAVLNERALARERYYRRREHVLERRRRWYAEGGWVKARRAYEARRPQFRCVLAPCADCAPT